MDIEKQFDFLVKDYGLKYSHQTFKNCYNGHWVVYAYSFYNESGCFTIYELGQRGEWDYYYAKRHSNIMEELLENRVDIYSVEKEIWGKARKKIFHSIRTELATLAEVIKKQIQTQGNFYGVKIPLP